MFHSQSLKAPRPRLRLRLDIVDRHQRLIRGAASRGGWGGLRPRAGHHNEGQYGDNAHLTPI